MSKQHRGIILACACLLALTLTTAALLRPAMASPAGGEALVELSDGPPLVALTFDDGPRPDTTARLLDGLALREAQATFFLVGERIPGNEALIQRMSEEGHQVGVHSYSHIRITALSGPDFNFEVGKTRAQLTNILGSREFWLRPPYGIVDDSVLKRAGSPVILWSLDPEDWKDRDVDRIVGAVLSQVRDGDIILFHDIYDSSVDAALQVTDALLQRGYCLVTVEQLFQLKEISLQNGIIYQKAK